MHAHIRDGSSLGNARTSADVSRLCIAPIAAHPEAPMLSPDSDKDDPQHLQVGNDDPLDAFCEDNPDADECRCGQGYLYGYYPHCGYCVLASLAWLCLRIRSCSWSVINAHHAAIRCRVYED